MVQEQYVNFETAKLLKEKGFNQYTPIVYDENGNYMPDGVFDDLGGTYRTFIPMPTQALVMRWLRDVKNIAITIAFDWDWVKDPMDPKTDINTQISEFAGWFYEIDLIDPHQHLKESNNYATYEEACEAAIKYCLTNLV